MWVSPTLIHESTGLVSENSRPCGGSQEIKSNKLAMQLTMAAHEEERHWKQRNVTRVESTSLFRNFPFGAFRGQLLKFTSHLNMFQNKTALMATRCRICCEMVPSLLYSPPCQHALDFTLTQRMFFRCRATQFIHAFDFIACMYIRASHEPRTRSDTLISFLPPGPF
jgi:hypothetical protein